MANLNKVLLIGNLTRDPELRYIPNGTAVAEFGLAVNRQWRDQNGQNQEETTFLDITVWGRQGETCNQYLSKGRSVFIEGRLQYDSWETQDGQRRSKIRVVAERVQFLGGGDRQGGPQGGPQGGQRQGGGRRDGPPPRRDSRGPEPSVQEGPADEDLNLDDIPF